MKSTKNQFEVKNKKDKHSFKAESTDVSNEWVSVLKGILEDKIPEEEASDEEKEKGEHTLCPAEHMLYSSTSKVLFTEQALNLE